MTDFAPDAPSDAADALPAPRDDDDDDVSWALKTAAVQWRRGQVDDARGWLERAVESAQEVGQLERAAEIQQSIAKLPEPSLGAVRSLRTEPPLPSARAILDSIHETLEEAAAHGLMADAVDGATPLTPVPEPIEARIAELRICDIEPLGALAEDAQLDLVRTASSRTLADGEELGGFALALVVEGAAVVSAAIADVACARLGRSEIVPAVGSLTDGVSLRVVAVGPAVIATWERTDVDRIVSRNPGVSSALCERADLLQALAGATLGPIGERLDDEHRMRLFERCRALAFVAGESVTLMPPYIVGAGRIESASAEHGPGDVVFDAAAEARAGQGGALALDVEPTAVAELAAALGSKPA